MSLTSENEFSCVSCFVCLCAFSMEFTSVTVYVILLVLTFVRILCVNVDKLVLIYKSSESM